MRMREHSKPMRDSNSPQLTLRKKSTVKSSNPARVSYFLALSYLLMTFEVYDVVK